ncbi:MAG: preprotein translocase subunit SecG [Phycisphaerae bacterium]
MLGFLSTFLAVLFGIVCLLLIGIVLLQKGRGGGLGAAFGGAGSSAFGTKTGDVMTWVTIVLVGLFLLLAMGTVVAMRTAPAMVTTPMFDPSPGPITEETDVFIGTQTRGTTIHYTLDGDEPTKDDKQIPNGGKIVVGPGTTIRARAYRAGWEPSKVAVASYPSEEADANALDTPPADANAPADGDGNALDSADANAAG